MSPLNPIPSWNERGIKGGRRPRVHWFFICEGSQTERKYFEKLFKVLDKQNLPVYAEGIYVRRTENDKTASHPKKLFEQADEIYNDESGKYGFDAEVDSIVIVFDLDIFRDVSSEDYIDYLDKLDSRGFLPAVTNPSFALYLLLHKQNAYLELIRPFEEELLVNKKENGTRYIDKHFSNKYQINPKTGPGIARLAPYYSIAQKEELNLNNDPYLAYDKLSSNIGIVINNFLNAGK